MKPNTIQRCCEVLRFLTTLRRAKAFFLMRLHIDCAKKAWRASNHKNVHPQMTKWLERREKIAMFETLCAQLHTKSSDAGAD